MEQILQLDEADDIASIKNRIDFTLPQMVSAGPGQTGPGKPNRRRLLLVVPRKNTAMRSLVNMKLLARVARTRALEIGVVSNNPTVRDYAREAGIKAFVSIKRAQWTRWISGQTAVAPPEATVPPAIQAPPDVQPEPPQLDEPAGEERDSTALLPSPVPVSLPERPKRPKRVEKKKYTLVIGSGRIGIWQQLGALLILPVLALILVLGVVTLLPRATVFLTPVSHEVEAELIVNADPNADAVDFQTLTFPARVDQVELALPGEIETIDTELAPVGLGGGVVTFINRTDVVQTIPISTNISTSAGEQIEFVTAQTATIPAGVGAITPTQVIAVEPGPKGNVRAGQINGFVDPAYALLARVVNEEPFEGGTMAPARIVVQDDKERLQAHLRQLILQEGLDRLEASLGEREFISPETLQVIVLDVSYNEFSGDLSDTFSGEMQAVVRGTVVGGYNANRLALAALQAQAPPGFELDIEGLHFGAGEVLAVEEGVISFKIFARGQYGPNIDGHEVAQEIAWLPVGEAQALLGQRYTLATVPGVELEPDWAVDWLGRLPFFSLRINVVIQDAVTLVADGN
jgi:hypothetical protein